MASTARERELATSRVLLHSFLLALTVVTTTLTGAALSVDTQDSESIMGALFAPVLASWAITSPAAIMASGLPPRFSYPPRR
jgi:phosphate/sulfate permease